MRVCSIEGCGKKHHSKGLCRAHYNRKKRHGSPHVILQRHCAFGEGRIFLERITETDDCIWWPFGRSKAGYGQLVACLDGEKYTTAHRVSLALKVRKPFKGAHALHSCNNGGQGCVNPKHLYWGTDADNARDRCEAGRSGNRLKRHDVIEMMRIYLRGGISQTQVGKKFGVCRQFVSRVLNGQSWPGIMQEVLT